MVEFLGVLAAGTATLASPCVLPLIPIYLAMLMGGSTEAVQDPQGRGRLVVVTGAFAVGFTGVFTALGLGASSLGGLLSHHRDVVTVVGAVIIGLMGLKFLGVWNIGWLDRDVRLQGPRRVTSVAGGLAFGVVFALGWTPCAGPVLAAVLGYAASAGSVVKGAALLAVYGLGMALPLVVVAAFADRAVPLLRRLMRHLGAMQKVTGVLMVGVALWIGGHAFHDMAVQPPMLNAVTRSGERLSPLLGAPLPKPRLVEVVEDGCTVCQRMEPRVQALQEDCTDHLVHVHVVSLSRPENAHLRKALEVRAVPTLLLVDDHGNVAERVVGERSLEELRGLAARLQATECVGVEPVDIHTLTQESGCPSTASVSDGQCG